MICRTPQHRPSVGRTGFAPHRGLSTPGQGQSVESPSVPRWPGRWASMAALPGRHPRRDTGGTPEEVRLDLLLNSASTSWWTGSRSRGDGSHFP